MTAEGKNEDAVFRGRECLRKVSQFPSQTHGSDFSLLKAHVRELDVLISTALSMRRQGSVQTQDFDLHLLIFSSQSIQITLLPQSYLQSKVAEQTTHGAGVRLSTHHGSFSFIFGGDLLIIHFCCRSSRFYFLVTQ